MYAPSTQFPEITNRESWSQLIGVYDDDSGDPISLSNIGGQGSFSAWNVQVMNALYGDTVLTAQSSSNLTIGNGTVNAVIGAGLAISAGQYVNFAAQSDATNFMQGQVASYNPTTGAITFSVASVSIQLEIRRAKGPGYNRDGYGPYATVGEYDWGAPILTASIGNGISIVDTGIFQVYFSETSMRSLGPGMHSVAATLTSADGIDTRQLFLGRLPVAYGGVTN
jgi:hypothetical protein